MSRVVVASTCRHIGHSCSNIRIYLVRQGIGIPQTPKMRNVWCIFFFFLSFTPPVRGMKTFLISSHVMHFAGGVFITSHVRTPVRGAPCTKDRNNRFFGSTQSARGLVDLCTRARLFAHFFFFSFSVFIVFRIRTSERIHTPECRAREIRHE